MEKKITILVVTKDRLREYDLLLRRLSVLPWVHEVKIEVYDNTPGKDSVSLEVLNYKEELTREYRRKMDIEFYRPRSFMEARNESVLMCKTPYFTILDDDDYLSLEAIPMMMDALERFPGVEFYSFGAGREGRLDVWDSGYTLIDSMKKKLEFLNDFDNYSCDRVSKVYLRNSGHLISKRLAKDTGAKWKYLGCDDILPVTSMYLEADSILKINRPLFYYDSQGTIGAPKSHTQMKSLEMSMIASYSEIIDRYPEPEALPIIKKAINNSIRQMIVLDSFNSEGLIQLNNSLKLI